MAVSPHLVWLVAEILSVVEQEQGGVTPPCSSPGSPAPHTPRASPGQTCTICSMCNTCSPPHTYCFRFSGCEVHCESLQCSSGGRNTGEHSSSGPFLHTGLAQNTALPRKLCAQETLSLNEHNSSSVRHTLGNPALTSRLNIDPRSISCNKSVQLVMDCLPLDDYAIKLARSTSCHEAGPLTVCVPPASPPGSV